MKCVEHTLLEMAPVGYQTDFAGGDRRFESTYHFHLRGCEMRQGELRNDSDAVFRLDKAQERLDAPRFVLEIAAGGAHLFELAEAHDLRAHAMPLLEEPEVVNVDVLGEHVPLLKEGLDGGVRRIKSSSGSTD